MSKIKIGQIYKQEIAIFKIEKIDRFIWYRLYNPDPKIMQSFWSIKIYPIDKGLFQELLDKKSITEYSLEIV